MRFLILILLLIAARITPAEPPPNIVLIFMDDMGYADITPFGATAYQTPNLQALANEGRVFRDFVVSSAVCSASRAALMTGCLHSRVGIEGALSPRSSEGLNPSETTIAELCKSRGYATACYGKWHLGHDPKHLPTNQGFDFYYGIPYSNDMWPENPKQIAKRAANPNAEVNYPGLPMIEATPGNVRVVNVDMSGDDQERMTAEFTRRGVRFIHDHADQPFFLYMPHPMVHVPLYVGDEWLGKSGAGMFADVVTEIDDSVGQIVNAVEQTGNGDNTLIIFTSDNGPWLCYGDHAGSAKPLREGKQTEFEGGVREPTIIRWTGKIPPGTKTETLCSTIDILPTIAAIIDADLPETTIDGLDIRSVMFDDESNAKIADRILPGYYGGQLRTIRNDRFKMVFPHRYPTLDGASGGVGGAAVSYQTEQAEFALYDLDADVSETTNVIAEFPDVVSWLNRSAEEYRQSLGDRLNQRVGNQIRPPSVIGAGDERLPFLWR